ncbi:hypothetical protein Fcan01_24921 [Folsomia candida]|uniref:Uncharacterized protein n=1 Tax=Folsomia candida TaxID=158441 RepID=A0A226D6B9_FOLCA|nr:hypothetical protein Fcan01_24921 [Folsomia candida]
MAEMKEWLLGKGLDDVTISGVHKFVRELEYEASETLKKVDLKADAIATSRINFRIIDQLKKRQEQITCKSRVDLVEETDRRKVTPPHTPRSRLTQSWARLVNPSLQRCTR